MKIEIDDNMINDLMADGLARAILQAGDAHHTDVCVRWNGQDKWHQADWLKHMTITEPYNGRRSQKRGQPMNRLLEAFKYQSDALLGLVGCAVILTVFAVSCLFLSLIQN